MKFIIALIFSLVLSASTFCQVLTNYTVLGAAGKSKMTCVAPPFWYWAYGNYLAPGSAGSNTWFYPTTNVLTITAVESNTVVTYTSDYGLSGCGRGSLTFTDIFYPNDTFRFGQYWSNSILIPTNPVALISVGFRTNSP